MSTFGTYKIKAVLCIRINEIKMTLTGTGCSLLRAECFSCSWDVLLADLRRDTKIGIFFYRRLFQAVNFAIGGSSETLDLVWDPVQIRIKTSADPQYCLQVRYLDVPPFFLFQTPGQ